MRDTLAPPQAALDSTGISTWIGEHVLGRGLKDVDSLP